MDTVTLDRPVEGVALVTLNRPDRHNAISYELLDDLSATLEEVSADDACRAIVLTGAGASFCSGLDLTQPAPERTMGRTQLGMRVQKQFGAIVPQLRALPQPVIAAVRGNALGGGMIVAAGCDIRIAGESARFSARFIRLGLSAGEMSTSWLLPRLIGASRAFELMLTGRDLAADEASAIGFVSKVVDDDAVVTEALTLAELIASYAPFGVQMTKEMMWSSLEIPNMHNALDMENRNQVLATMTKDFQEAVTAFGEKRPPRFTNH